MSAAVNLSTDFQVCQDLIQLSMKHDWDQAYEQVYPQSCSACMLMPLHDCWA